MKEEEAIQLMLVTAHVYVHACIHGGVWLCTSFLSLCLMLCSLHSNGLVLQFGDIAQDIC